MLLAIGIIGVRDGLEAETTIWQAVGDLQRDGVPVSQIDAGYTVNGWLQCAHPEQAHRDARGQVAVPFINGEALLPWIVAAAPMPDADSER